MILTPQRISDQRDYAVSFRTQLLRGYTEAIRDYTTSAHLDEQQQGEAWDEPHNHLLELASRLLPRIAGGIPQFAVRTPRSGVARQYAAAQAAAANLDARISKTAEFRELSGFDLIQRYACSITREEPLPGHSDVDDPPNRPSTERLSLRDFFFDPGALTKGTWRFAGHDLRDPVDELLELAREDKTWKRSQIEALTTTSMRYPDDDRRSDSWDEPDEKWLQYAQIWVADATPERVKHWLRRDYLRGEKWDPEIHHGYIFTVSVAGDAGGSTSRPYFIRDPYPYFGPRTGPYNMGGVLCVPDESVPLSLATATTGHAKTLNAFKKALEEAMESWKRIWAVASTDPDIADAITTTPSGETIILDDVDDLRNKMVSMELGGPSPDMIQAVAIAQADYDRMTGTSDAAGRGAVTGNATASENIIASQATELRSGWVEHKAIGYYTEIATKEAWYRHYSERIIYLVGDEIADDADPRILLGGSHKPTQIATLLSIYPEMDREMAEALLSNDVKMPFDELELILQPWSLRHMDEQMRQAQAAMLDSTLATYPALQMQFPWLPWREFWRMRLEMVGLPSLADQIDHGWAEEVAAQLLQQPGREAQPTPEPQARFSFAGSTPQIGHIGGGAGGFTTGNQGNVGRTGEVKTPFAAGSGSHAGMNVGPLRTA